jgi:hypothetical protein
LIGTYRDVELEVTRPFAATTAFAQTPYQSLARDSCPIDAAKRDWLETGIHHDSLPHAVADNRSPLGD